jgi:hypothetical protein
VERPRLLDLDDDEMGGLMGEGFEELGQGFDTDESSEDCKLPRRMRKTRVRGTDYYVM